MRIIKKRERAEVVRAIITYMVTATLRGSALQPGGTALWQEFMW
jgi:hypothetical protein